MIHRAHAAATALVLSSCVLPTGTIRTGHPVHGPAEKIVSGVTTREELLRLVGPPMAVARRGEYVSFDAASSPRGSWAQQADAWLEPFAVRRPLVDDHRVYYWYFIEVRRRRVLAPFFPLLFIWSESRASAMEELWVLVDEGPGVVVDLVRR